MYGDYTRKDQVEDVFRAAEEGNVAELAYYLDDGCGADLRHPNGHTLLVQALISRHGDCARMILAAGADPDAVIQATGQTALHYAAGDNDTAMIAALLERGATIDFPDDFNWTPLHMATARGKLDAIRALVEAGADLGARDRQNDTPLDLATLRAAHSLETISKPFPPIVAYLQERMDGAARETAQKESVERDIAALKRHNPGRYRLRM